MFPLIAAISQVGGILIDKVLLTRRQMAIHVYIPLVFLFLAVFTGLFFPWWGKIESGYLSPYYIGLFILMICTSIIWNFWYYKGVQSEKVHEYELIIVFQPLLTILLAALIFPQERNLHIIIASIIASLTLAFSHIKKQHFMLSPGSWYLIGAVIFISIELIIIHVLLGVYSPVALYFLRTGILFFFFYLFYKPELSKVSALNIWLTLATAVLGVAQMVSKFYGFEK